MPEKFVATPADEIGFPEETIELPVARTKSGASVYVTVRLVPTEIMAPIIGGVPDAVLPQGGDQPIVTNRMAADQIIEWHGHAVTLAKVGVVAPEFDYEGMGTAGKAPWAALTMEDKAAVFNAILHVSGYSGKKADGLARFPDGDEDRRAAGGTNAGSRPNGDTPARAAGEWPTAVPARGPAK